MSTTVYLFQNPRPTAFLWVNIQKEYKCHISLALDGNFPTYVYLHSSWLMAALRIQTFVWSWKPKGPTHAEGWPYQEPIRPANHCFVTLLPSGKPSSQLHKHQTQEKEVLDKRLNACNETAFSIYARGTSIRQIHIPEHFLFTETRFTSKRKTWAPAPRLTWLLSLSTFLKHLFKDKLCLTEFFHPVGAFAKYGKCSKIQ